MDHFKSDDIIICFTDGSCINNGKKDAVGGYGGYFPYHQELNFSSKISSETIATNNIAELLAILEAIRSVDLDHIEKVLIYTDSKYCFKIFTDWIFTWIRNNKINKYKNCALIQEIYSYIKNPKYKDKIQFFHCLSHQKEPQNKISLEYFIWKGNFEADKLAGIT